MMIIIKIVNGGIFGVSLLIIPYYSSLLFLIIPYYSSLIIPPLLFAKLYIVYQYMISIDTHRAKQTKKSINVARES
jgi:hypothetical protein